MHYGTAAIWIFAEAHSAKFVIIASLLVASSTQLQIEGATGVRDPLTILVLVGATVAAVVTLATSIAALLIVAHSNSRLRQEVKAERVRREEERLRRDREIEAALKRAQEAQRIEDHADRYRQRLASDKSITELKILTMTWPLDLISIYVQLVLHHQTRPDFIHEDLLKAEALQDPNLLLRASQLQLEKRANVAIPPDEAIRIYKRCVIVGNPGAGKTTLLKYLALKSASRQLSGLSDVPIHIDLNVFVSSKVSVGPDESHPLLAFAAEKWGKDYDFPKADAYKYLEKNLQTGNALLLLDGLDETLTGINMEEAEKSYNRIAGLILKMAKDYPQAHIVVTARIAGYQQHSPLSGFTELEILDFRPRDIEQFIHNWFINHPARRDPRQAFELNEKLRQIPRIQSLASNPLLLALVVLVYEKLPKLPMLPERRAAIYDRCVETLLAEWDSDPSHTGKRERVRPLTVTNTRRLMEKVAWHFHRQGRRFFPKDDIIEQIKGFIFYENISCESAKVVLEEIAEETGLLREFATGWYGFLHLTLQEFFVSQEIDHRKDDGFTTLFEHIGDPWWEEVLLLYAERTAFQEKLLKTLLMHEDQATDTLFHTYLLLVGRCQAAHPTKTKRQEEISSRLFELLHTTSYSLTRQQTAEVLAELGISYKDENEQLMEMVIDEQLDICVRTSIVDALGLFCSGPPAEKLAQYLANDLIHPKIRIRIALALGKSAVRFVSDQLIELLERRLLDDDIRVSIAAALGASGEIALASKLVPLLMNNTIERGVKVRCSIADAIGTLGDTSVVLALRQLLPFQDELGFAIYWRVIIALASLGQIENISMLFPILYDDKDYAVWTRREIVDALGSLRLLSLVPDLLPLLPKKEIDWQVRVSIAIAVGAAGDRTIIPKLLEYLADEWIDTNVRASIAAILASLCDVQHIPVLRRVYIDRDIYPQVYRSIIVTRCKLGDTKTISHLLKWLTDTTTELAERLTILDALAALQNNSVVPDLLELLKNSQVPKEVRQSITSVLILLANEPAVIENVRRRLEDLLPTSDIADDIHQALWIVSRRGSGILIDKR